jgi:hypothetical protein
MNGDAKFRAWYADELAFKDVDELMEAARMSDDLADELWTRLFGRHPGVQLLTIADMAARWIQHHEAADREHAIEVMIKSLVMLAKTTR